MSKRFSKNFSPAFTLIELLVVIAIIGILSAVVLSQLNQARSKGGDAAVKNNLNNMRSYAESLYETPASPNGYSSVCADSKMTALKDAAVSAGGTGLGTCRNGVGYWVAWAGLKTNSAQAWCVDNTGASRQIAIPGAISACP
jgi:prepilin-type N-terminal cleavage/methylation domain-containing protein